MRLTRLLIAAAVLDCTTAQAVNWVRVAVDGEPGDQVVASADADTVRVRNGLRQAWVRYEFDKPPASEGAPHRTAQLLMHYDCSAQVSTFSRVQMFSDPGAAGTLLVDRSWTAPTTADAMKPDKAGSLAHQVLRHVCAASPRN